MCTRWGNYDTEVFVQRTGRQIAGGGSEEGPVILRLDRHTSPGHEDARQAEKLRVPSRQWEVPELT